MGDEGQFGKIGVLMGGVSSEREVSLRSGKAILRALLEGGFNAEAVDLVDENYESTLSSCGLDFAFIALHGAGGEDGTVQLILEKLDIPYLGSDPLASRKAFDKIKAKKVFASNHIPTPRFEVLTAEDWSEKLDRLHFPVFVKPSCEGSSIDVHLILSRGDAREIVVPLMKKHCVFIAEEKVEGPELTVSLMGSRALPVVEIRPRRAFYDYTAKYTRGLTEYIVPAELGDKETRLVQETALRVHEALGLRDFSRVDIILSKGVPYVLEANTIPGFTETSLFPKAARAVGLDFSGLCRELVRIAGLRLEGKKNERRSAAGLQSSAIA